MEQKKVNMGILKYRRSCEKETGKVWVHLNSAGSGLAESISPQIIPALQGLSCT